MDTNRTIIAINDFIRGASDTLEGFALFNVLNEKISKGEKIALSFHEYDAPLSTSFLSSSFGALYDTHGFNAIKEYISLINFQPNQAKKIKEYLEKVKNLQSI